MSGVFREQRLMPTRLT